MVLLATRLVDVAIFGAMGALWVTGALVIYYVWRWVIDQERAARTAAEPVPIHRRLDPSAVPPPLRERVTVSP